jgi:hypothetical protein
MNDLWVCQAVAAQLFELIGVVAWAEHTGGWMFCVLVPEQTPADTVWFWGTANFTWGGTLRTPDGENLVNLETDVLSTSQDAAQIAQAIAGALAGYHARP